MPFGTPAGVIDVGLGELDRLDQVENGRGEQVSLLSVAVLERGGERGDERMGGGRGSAGEAG